MGRKIQKQDLQKNNKQYPYRIQKYQARTIKQMIMYALIRPSRFVYNEQILQLSSRIKHRFQYQVYNIPFPLSVYTTENMEYLVLYLHGNSSSRYQGYMQLFNLPQNVGLACFDFNGCGLRTESQYITLGKNQSAEVTIAIRFLKNLGYKVVGWGRSMGSVSLLMSQQCDVMVVDSPFYSLRQLCRELALQEFPQILCCLFNCLYTCIEGWIRDNVMQTTNMDIFEMEINHYVNKMSQHKNIIFLAAESDKMINSNHSARLYEIFKGNHKKLSFFDGTHNSNRPLQVLKQAFSFIHQSLGLPEFDTVEYQRFINKRTNTFNNNRRLTDIKITNQIAVNKQMSIEVQSNKTPFRYRDNNKIQGQLYIQNSLQFDSNGPKISLLNNTQISNFSKSMEIQDVEQIQIPVSPIIQQYKLPKDFFKTNTINKELPIKRRQYLEKQDSSQIKQDQSKMNLIVVQDFKDESQLE